MPAPITLSGRSVIFGLYHPEELEVAQWYLELELDDTEDFFAPLLSYDTRDIGEGGGDWKFKPYGAGTYESLTYEGITTDRWDTEVDNNYFAGDVKVLIPDYVFDALVPGTTYYVRVRASTADEGEWTVYTLTVPEPEEVTNYAATALLLLL